MQFGRALDAGIIRVEVESSGGTLTALKVDKICTGGVLKQLLEPVCKIPAQDQVLECAGTTGGNTSTELFDAKTMEAQGVEDGARIRVRRRPMGKPSSTSETSASQESISRHGRLSYYHNNREDAAFDPALRIAAGGDPVRLAEVSGSDTSVPIAYWSWSDDGKTVKIYIEADQEPRAVAAAERESPETDFTQDSFRLTVNDDGRSFVLFVQHLHHDIHPRQSKVRVSAGKRITVVLQKLDPAYQWFRLTGR